MTDKYSYRWKPEEGGFNGSLVGYVVVRHGTDGTAFTDDDMKGLKKWMCLFRGRPHME